MTRCSRAVAAQRLSATTDLTSPLPRTASRFAPLGVVLKPFGLDFIRAVGNAQNVADEPDGLSLAAFQLGAGELLHHSGVWQGAVRFDRRRIVVTFLLDGSAGVLGHKYGRPSANLFVSLEYSCSTVTYR